MRLFFEKGRQRQLLEEYKLSQKAKYWSDVAKQLGVNEDALKEWRYETASLPSSHYSILDPSGRYKRWIIAQKDDQWGRSLGGQNSPGAVQPIQIPAPSPLLAEFFGIILGDGNVYLNEKHGVYQVRVASHPIDEQDYSQFVSEMFETLFGLTPQITRRGRARYVDCSSKKVTLYLIENLPGLQAPFVFPSWILYNPQNLRAFVRGLVDTDGSIYRLSNKDPQTIRISFSNTDDSLSAAYRQALLRLGFHPSKKIYRNVFLTRRADTQRYLKEIGFHNSKHSKRLLAIAPSSSSVKDTRL